MTEFPETRTGLLVQLLSRDNREAWETFAAIYQPVIYRMARRRGMQDADAQDLVQDVLVRVSAAIGRYAATGCSISNWLARVAKNTILTTLTRSPRDLGQGGTDACDELEQHPEDSSAVNEELDSEVSVSSFCEPLLSSAPTSITKHGWRSN